MSTQRGLFDLEQTQTPICSQCHGDLLTELATAPGRFRCKSCGWLTVVSSGESKPMVDPYQPRKKGRR